MHLPRKSRTDHCVASTTAITFDCRNPLRQVFLGACPLVFFTSMVATAKACLVGCRCSSFAQPCSVRVMRAAPSVISFSSCVHGCDAFRFRLGVCACHHSFKSFAQSYGSLFVPLGLLLSFPLMGSASGVSWSLCYMSPSLLCFLCSKEPLLLLGRGFAAWLMLLRNLFGAASFGAASSVCEVAHVDCCVVNGPNSRPGRRGPAPKQARTSAGPSLM